MKQSKIRVAVLYGGRSAEHEVSLQSAANVIQHLDKNQFEIIPIGIDKQGRWFLGANVFANSLEQNQVSQLIESTWFTPEWVGNPLERQTIKVQDLIPQSTQGSQFDVVIPMLHGTLCEDGTLQGLLEIAGLPYVGCGVLSSAIGMDKDVAKRLAKHAGVRVAPYLVVKRGQWQTNSTYFSQQIADTLSYPVFVKPANAGSSIGITKVHKPEHLLAAMDEAFRFDTKVLVEKALNALELEVAVLESLTPGQAPIVSIVGEIKPSHEFYSYDAKYTDVNGAELLIPASVNEAIREQAQSMAKTIFAALECEGMARVDLFFDKNDQQIYFNEINTIPGFTQISMYPKLMSASGIAYSELLTHLIQLAMQKHQHKNKLIRSYAD